MKIGFHDPASEYKIFILMRKKSTYVIIYMNLRTNHFNIQQNKVHFLEFSYFLLLENECLQQKIPNGYFNHFFSKCQYQSTDSESRCLLIERLKFSIFLMKSKV